MLMLYDINAEDVQWMKMDIILGDAGYDAEGCFNEAKEHGQLPEQR